MLPRRWRIRQIVHDTVAAIDSRWMDGYTASMRDSTVDGSSENRPRKLLYCAAELAASMIASATACVTVSARDTTLGGMEAPGWCMYQEMVMYVLAVCISRNGGV